MKKILVIIHPQKPDGKTIDFACYLAKLTGASLTGVFIENLYFEYTMAHEKGYVSYAIADREKDVQEKVVRTDIDQSNRWFLDHCRLRGIKGEIYQDKGEPVLEVVFESRFADLMILDATLNFYGRVEDIPSAFVKEVLVRAECPVMIAPGNFEDVEEIEFCYDGSDSAVFAIKQFTYLLPQFRGRKIKLLEITDTEELLVDQSHLRMMSWLRDHYEHVQYCKLKGEVKDELFLHFLFQRKKLVVMGSYGRGLLSYFFKHSSADVLMRMVDLPIFITHH